MKEGNIKIIQSDYGLCSKMKLINKYKSCNSRININCNCDSVVNNSNGNFFKVKRTLFILFVLFGIVCGGESRDGGETNTSCPSCQVRDSRELALINIQNKIMDALGYHDIPPKIPHNNKRTFLPLISTFIEMYKEGKEPGHPLRHHPNDIDDQPQIQLQEELSQGEPCHQCMRYDGKHVPILFRLENTTAKNDNYKSVSLMLYVNNTGECDEAISVNIYQLIYLPGRKEYKQIKTAERKPDAMSWIYIDVGGELQNHLINPSYTNNITFIVDLSYRNKNNPKCPDLNKEMAFHALLKFQYDEKVKKRSKRTPVRQDCKENQNYTECCRYPLTVDFDEMKWDFIITPRKYDAYHCAGECPLMFKHSVPHTHLIQQMKARGGPCCTPKKMNPITMLYFSPRGTILYSKVGGMVVETCGCA